MNTLLPRISCISWHKSLVGGVWSVLVFKTSSHALIPSSSIVLLLSEETSRVTHVLEGTLVERRVTSGAFEGSQLCRLSRSTVVLLSYEWGRLKMAACT